MKVISFVPYFVFWMITNVVMIILLIIFKRNIDDDTED